MVHLQPGFQRRAHSGRAEGRADAAPACLDFSCREQGRDRGDDRTQTKQMAPEVGGHQGLRTPERRMH